MNVSVSNICNTNLRGIQNCLNRDHSNRYYVSKKVGGWGWPNAYVCLQGGWVGLAKCLRNHKNHQKRPNGPVGEVKYNLLEKKV